MRTTDLSRPGASSRRYVHALYGLWSGCYDAMIALDPAYSGNAEALVRATVRNGDRVLDVGVGTGLLASTGARHSAEYVGLDLSGSMLARAARRMAREQLASLRLAWGDMTALPFAEGQFDAVLSAFALPHLDKEDKGRALVEMARVLRPGGRLGLMLAQGEHAPLFASRGQLTTWLGRAGFVDVQLMDRDGIYRLVTAVRAHAST